VIVADDHPLYRDGVVGTGSTSSVRGTVTSDRALVGRGSEAPVMRRRLKKMCDDRVTEAHVFLAGPAPLALFLGASINAGPAMTLYHAADGEYVRSVRVPA
jgi:hypothetical protein